MIDPQAQDVNFEHVVPQQDWSRRPPSPPHIHIPPTRGTIELSLYNCDYNTKDEEELNSVTQIPHVVKDSFHKWEYTMRRKAQLILPFLYLGPVAAAKDRQFLKAEGITMLVAVRDMKSAIARMMNVDAIAKELGLVSKSIDVDGPHGLIAAFRGAIRDINEHLLEVSRYNRDQGDSSRPDQNYTSSEHNVARGKVLVFCESGNERSACVVAAYIMDTYKMDVVAAVQFIQGQRFCVAMDDIEKGLLMSFWDLILARKLVNAATYSYPNSKTLILSGPVGGSPLHKIQNMKGKRRIEDTMDVEMDMGNAETVDDIDRFQGRGGVVPFVDWS